MNTKLARLGGTVDPVAYCKESKDGKEDAQPQTDEEEFETLTESLFGIGPSRLHGRIVIKALQLP